MPITLDQLAVEVLNRLEETYPPVFWNLQGEVYPALIYAANEAALITGEPEVVQTTPFVLAPDTTVFSLPTTAIALLRLQAPQWIAKTSLWDMDRMMPGWESDVGAVPDYWFPVGMNQFAIHPQLLQPVNGFISYVGMPVQAASGGPPIELLNYSFTQPNRNPLDPAVWTIFGAPALQIFNNQCIATALGIDCAELYTGLVFPNDQYAKFTIGQVAGVAGLFVRSSIINSNGYAVEITGPLGPNTNIFLTVNGTTQLGSFTGNVSPGDSIGLSAIGSTIQVSQNNVPIITATDTTLTSGAPGMFLGAGSVLTDTWATAFSAGGVPTAPTGLSTLDYQPEFQEGIIDYAAHILQAKEGGEEFMQSAKLYDRFLAKMTELSNFSYRKDSLRFTRTMGVPARITPIEKK
jgi:hypothetical protein